MQKNVTVIAFALLLQIVLPGTTSQAQAQTTPYPAMAPLDPEEHATIFMIWVGQWSDGTPGPPITHTTH